MEARDTQRCAFLALSVLLLASGLPSAQWEATDHGVVIAARVKASPGTLNEGESVSLLVMCNRATAPAEVQVAVTTRNVGVLVNKGAAYQVVGETTESAMQPLPIIPDGPSAQSVRIAPAIVSTFLRELAGATLLRLQVTDALGRLR